MSKKIKLIVSAVMFLAKNAYKHRSLIEKVSKKALHIVGEKKAGGKKSAPSKAMFTEVPNEVKENVASKALSPSEERKLKELQVSYLEQMSKNAGKSEMYAALGAAGVSPKNLTKFEKSVSLIEEFTKNQKRGN